MTGTPAAPMFSMVLHQLVICSSRPGSPSLILFVHSSGMPDTVHFRPASSTRLRTIISSWKP